MSKKGTIFFSMKTAQLLPLLLLSIWGITFCNFSKPLENIAEQTVKPEHIKEVDTFKDRLSSLISFVEEEQWTVAQQQFIECRNAFKHIDYLLQYTFEESYRSINGPDLRYLNPGFRGIAVLEPEGLQAIEGQLFEEQPEKKKLILLIKRLLWEIEKYKSYLKNTTISNEDVFTALRFNMIKLETLDLTGFEVPVCNNIANEVTAILQTYQQVMGKFGKNKEILVFDELVRDAILEISKMRQPDGFNRLKFIKEHIQPLTKQFLQVQEALHIPYPKGLIARKIPIEYTSKTIYDPNFIDANMYSEFRMDQADEGVVKLGALLFFDPLLSSDNKMACASCHQPERAFQDGMATAITNQEGIFQERNSPTLLNAGLQPFNFFDLSGTSLENQAEHVFFNKREFHTSLEEVSQKLSKSSAYVTQFKKAFPEYQEDPINGFTILRSLGAFVRTLQNNNSILDDYMTGKTKVIPAEVANGFNIFMGKGKCGTCHFAPTFFGNVPPFYNESESEVLGVTKNNDFKYPVLDGDSGRYKFKAADIFMRSFKTATVRNIDQTSPYMHNGALKTLEEVVEFYNKGGGQGLGLEVPNQTLSADSLQLSEKEKKDLIVFLKALNGKPIIVQVPKLPKVDNHPEWDSRRGVGY
ncbi:MAG: hypothetical protein K1X55_14265 [Chitinophagales bacterium]|nr:hypothetical protein [Chitinophagales bacterium]